MESNQQNSSPPTLDSRVAVISQSLYLTNISVLPIISFLILLPIYYVYRSKMQAFGLQHCRQAILANIASGILLIIVSGAILLFGSFDSPYTWILLILYFISVHSALILYGVFALIKAIVGEKYTYPVLGRFWQN